MTDDCYYFSTLTLIKDVNNKKKMSKIIVGMKETINAVTSSGILDV